MIDPTERLEYFATNDTAHGGDLLSEADCEEQASTSKPALRAPYERCHSNNRFCEQCGIVHTEKFPCQQESAYDENEHRNCPECQPDPALQDVFAYLRAVKRFGLALQQLGRPCDKP